MYGHFTFLNYYFKGTSQIIKLVKKKKKRERKVIKTKERKRKKWDKKNK